MFRSRRRLLPLLILLTLASAPGRADSPRVKSYTCGLDEIDKLIQDSVYDTSDLNCEKTAWTAMSQLPPVRIIVFDPMSSSFSFVSLCPNEGNRNNNLDYFDRRRLALPTQKLRLLVLPYNPADQEVVISHEDGKCVEIEETAVAGAPPSPVPPPKTGESATDKAKEAERQVDKATSKLPKGANEKAKTLLGKFTSELNNKKINLDLSDVTLQAQSATTLNLDEFQGWLNPSETTGERAIADRLAKTDAAALRFQEESRDLLQKIKTALDHLSCVNSHLQAVPEQLAAILSSHHMSTAVQDLPLCAVVAEALARSKEIQKDRYVTCSKENEKATFADDVRALQDELQSLDGESMQLAGLVKDIRQSVDIMDGMTTTFRALGLTSGMTRDWEENVRLYREQIKDAEEFLSPIDQSLDEAKNTLVQLRRDRESFIRAQHERAEPFHKFTHNPLYNGNSIAFTAKRGSDEVAKLTVCSAPAYNVRFGVGIVASNLKNRTFTAGAEDSATKMKSIVAEDTSQILPIVAVHHYWGKRSPLLSPTLFERFMPTFSLAIPLSKSELLEQALFGLTWDLTPGVELSIGVNVGRVNDLVKGYTVGQQVPSSVDVSTIQGKKMDTAFYFGIVLNRDSFNALFDGQKAEGK